MSAGRRLPEAGEDFQRTIGGLLESGHAVVELEPDAVLDHVAFDEARHFRIERGHDLIEPLDQRHFEPAVDQVFHHLEADEAAADHHRTLRRHHRLVARVRVHAGSIRRIPVQPLADVPGVRHGSHREDSRQIDAGQRRTDRRRAGRQHELVVFLGRYLTGHVVLEVHGFLCGRDANHLATRPDVDRELLAKGLFRRHQEARLLFDRAADMVRQPAVRVRNIGPALDHEDLSFFVQPAQARRTRCAASHSTNDDDLHFELHPFLNLALKRACSRPH